MGSFWGKHFLNVRRMKNVLITSLDKYWLRIYLVLGSVLGLGTMKMNTAQIPPSLELKQYKRNHHINKSSYTNFHWSMEKEKNRQGFAEKVPWAVLGRMNMAVNTLVHNVILHKGFMRGAWGKAISGKNSSCKSMEQLQKHGAWKIFLCGWSPM